MISSLFRSWIIRKMAYVNANVEKSPLIRFVDELDFKQIPVSVKRKKKEECPSNWFKLWIEEGWKFKRKFQSRGRWTRRREQQWSGPNIQLLFGKWRNFKKRREAREKGKPRATTSVKKSSKRRKASKNILSEEEVEELRERLESKRHDLDCEIARKLESSPNLAFYPSRAALKEAILGDKSDLNEITDEFVDEFIRVIHDVYHTKMTATDNKAVLLISWSSSWEFVTWTIYISWLYQYSSSSQWN